MFDVWTDCNDVYALYDREPNINVAVWLNQTQTISIII